MTNLNKIIGLRMEYPQKPESYFLTLDEYTVFAKKCIARFVPVLAKKLLLNDDFITDVTHDIIMADWRWNGKGSRVGYRSKCAQWSIFEKLRQRKKEIKTISIDDEISFFGNSHNIGCNGIKTKRIKDLLEDKTIRDNEVTEDLLKQFSLTKVQTKYLLRTINGENPKEIAEEDGVTKQFVYLSIKLAKEKIRRFYDKKYAL